MSGSMHAHEAAHIRDQGAQSMSTARTRSRDRLRLLAEAIEAEIVPRLVAGHSQDRQAITARPSRNHPTSQPDSATAPLLKPTAQAAIDLAGHVLDPDETISRAFIETAVARSGLESVCLDLLAPAARHLGDLWNDDLCSFTDVTIGLMRLQSTLLAITTPTPSPAETGAAGASPRRTALLAPMPGEQHTFGLTMVAGFLDRAGWSVTQLHDGSVAAIEAAIRAGWFGVLGFSAGSDAKLHALGRLLPGLRAMSRNPNLGIIVGGPLFVAKPELAGEIGADATAVDGPNAVQAAEALIAPHRTGLTRAPRRVATALVRP